MPTVRRRLVVAALTVAAIAAGAPAALAAPQPGLNAEYFDYTDLTGEVAERIDQTVDFDWGLGEPVPGVGADFSARWSGVVTPPADGTYTFVTKSDDGVRLRVNGQLIIDDWNLHSAAERSGHITLEGGEEYDLELEYFDGLKHASVRLFWRRGNAPKAIVPASALTTERTAPGPGPTPDPGAGPDPVPDPDPVVVDPDPEPVVQVPKPGGIAAIVVPTGDGTTVPQIVPPSLLPEAPSIVSYGGPLAPPAPPVPGVSFNAAPEGGDVLVRRPADGQLIPLQQGASLPIGTHVDVREGGVDIQTAPADGVAQPTQDAHFEGGMFKVGQSRRNGKVVTIDLLHGEFAEVCGPLSRR
ncbi:MAG: PA14 domain-containing protein, partial [Actinomycetota bacterium]|nr:PA14 domain-containing protein [Actinomycetota bacterium]